MSPSGMEAVVSAGVFVTGAIARGVTSGAQLVVGAHRTLDEGAGLGNDDLRISRQTS